MDKTDVSLSKMKMELVWHNCETCPPKEPYNECLFITNGGGVFEVEWDNGYWIAHEGRNLGNVNEHKDTFWWADLDQTTEAFFKSVGLFKPTFL